MFTHFPFRPLVIVSVFLELRLYNMIQYCLFLKHAPLAAVGFFKPYSKQSEIARRTLTGVKPIAIPLFEQITDFEKYFIKLRSLKKANMESTYCKSAKKSFI